MFLRMLVSQFIRQTAEKKIYEAMRSKQSGSPTGDAQSETSEGQPLTEDIPPCHVAFVFALGVESGGLVDLLPGVVTSRCQSFIEHVAYLDKRRIVVIESGVGCKSAAKATDDLIAIHQPSWVVSAGFAGGLCDELGRGHILMADKVTDLKGNQLSVGLKLDPQQIQATKGLHVGRLLTVDKIIDTQEKKRELGKRHDALACDMETMAVAQACSRAHIRFLSVRIISDTVTDKLPKEVEGLLNQPSLVGKLGAATGAIFKRPSSIKDMWKLKENALKASDRLAKFLVGVVDQLTD